MKLGFFIPLLLVYSYVSSQETQQYVSTSENGVNVYKSTGVEKRIKTEGDTLFFSEATVQIADYTLEECENAIEVIQGKIEVVKSQQNNELRISNYLNAISELENRIVELKKK